MMYIMLVVCIEDIDVLFKLVLMLVGLFDQYIWVCGEVLLNVGEMCCDKLLCDCESECWGRLFKYFVIIDDVIYWYIVDCEGDIYEILVCDIELGIDFVICVLYVWWLVDEE